MKRALVTGANRGIGLEICRQLAEKDYEVCGVCRQASNELSKAAARVIENIDVGSNECIGRLSSELDVPELDLIVNCAGILERVEWDELDFSSIERQIQINALGPLRVVKAVEDKLSSGSKIVMITSRMGSIGDNTSGSSYGYRMSKTALNMASVSLAHDLKSREIAVGIVHPGYVRTDMTHHSGHIEPPESVRGILKRAEELNLDNTGTFWHQNGDILPW
ncbi:MAG: SDR family oxidoreductase [Candidatus Omnitrophota bacterium]